MRSPMGFVALALAAGIGLEWWLQPGLFWMAGFLLAAGMVAWVLRRRAGWSNLCWAFLLIGVGALRAELDHREPLLIPGPAALEGTLMSDSGLSRDGRSYVAWFRAEGRLLQARLPSRAGQFRYGDRLKLHGMLREGRTSSPLTRPSPPSGERVRERGRRFDERRWLWVHGASGVLNVTNKEGIVRLGSCPGAWTRYRWWVARLRRALANQGRALLAPEEAGMLEALMLGEGRGIRPETWEAFRRTGTLHVLVVSGSHVGLIGLISMTFLLVIRTPRTARYLLLAGTLVTYCLLSGTQPPILRATLAGLLLCWAGLRGVRTSPFNLLGAAAAAILAAQPRALADAGCQLSFAAVAGILWADAWMRREQSVPGTRRVPGTGVFLRVKQAAVISIAAWAATAPLIAWHFGTFSPLAPLANLVVVPWASLLIAVGSLLCGLGLLVPWVAGPFAAAFAVMARGLTASVQWASGLPGVFWSL